MPWSSKAKRQAILLVAVVVPGLMFGLGIGGYLLAREAGLGSIAFLMAMVFSTVGLAISILLTLNAGKSGTKRPAKKNPKTKTVYAQNNSFERSFYIDPLERGQYENYDKAVYWRFLLRARQ